MWASTPSRTSCKRRGSRVTDRPMRWSMRRLMPFSKKSSARPCRQQRTCQYPRAHRAEAGDRHPRRRREGQGRKERRGVAGQEQRHQREGRGGEHGSQDIGQDRSLGQRPEGGSGCNAGPGSAPCGETCSDAGAAPAAVPAPAEPVVPTPVEVPEPQPAAPAVTPPRSGSPPLRRLR